ncbi:MAG: 50S ribosomal protein L44e [Nanoarchaeota archaeon]|nr:50S ribosomal protein L44e [Nanoarchaeota archaeon]MBU1631725.1 50S ribosomal protein L44e [Nanoarchaeota archaeon]MBU1875868.1 50S ribosomal protein L44e [Nanoarchaeota archaeon]
MKIPKTIKRLCTKCKKHTEQKVHNQSFRGLNKTHTMSRGSKGRTMKRGLRRGTGNLGRFSRPAIAKWKMTGAKNTKKTDLRYTCSICKKVSCQSEGIRTKKVELI